MRKRSVVLVLIVTMAFLVIGRSSAGGHGAVIRLAVTSVAAGDSLALTGEGLGESTDITLVLEGASYEAVLATVRGDERGRFATVVRIPPEATPGAYRVVATAGEDTAGADLMVTRATASEKELSDPGQETPDRARADALELDRRRVPGETGLTWGVALLLLGLGVWLRRKSE